MVLCTSAGSAGRECARRRFDGAPDRAPEHGDAAGSCECAAGGVCRAGGGDGRGAGSRLFPDTLEGAANLLAKSLGVSGSGAHAGPARTKDRLDWGPGMHGLKGMLE